jgi:hypothetical protein
LSTGHNAHRISDLTGPKPVLLLQPFGALRIDALTWNQQRDPWGVGAERFSCQSTGRSG